MSSPPELDNDSCDILLPNPNATTSSESRLTPAREKEKQPRPLTKHQNSPRRENHSFQSKLLLLFLLTSASADPNEPPCAVSNILNQEESPQGALVAWTSTCEDNDVLYKVYATQQRFKACVGNATESNAKNFEVGETKEKSYRLKKLSPFSEYQVEIIAILGGSANKTVSSSAVISTLPGVPETVPEASDDAASTYSQAVKFYWKPPNDCAKQNGRHDGYHVQVWGVDPWVTSNQSLEVKNLQAGVNLMYVQRLMPYTKYKLQVFTRNQNGLWNRAMPLELYARTQPTTPKPPSDVRLQPYETSVHMQWMPPYPPTGEVSRYIVRVGVNSTGNSIIWRQRHEVPASHGSCITDVPDAKDQSVCWVVTDLQPDTEYFFELQTWNADVADPSEFSFAVKTKTEAVFSGVTSTMLPSSTALTIDPDSSHSSSGGSSQVLVIVLCFVTAIIVLIVICFVLVYKIKMNRLKMRYEQNNGTSGSGVVGRHVSSSSGDNNRSSPDSTYAPGMSMATNTTRGSRASSYLHNWSSQIEEIQSRRLPEPPPNNDSISMKSKEIAVYSDAYSSDDSQYVDVNNVDGNNRREYTDVDGYLKPTFHKEDEYLSPIRPLTSTPKPKDFTSPRGSIPAESYESPRMTMTPRALVAKEHHPLASSPMMSSPLSDPNEVYLSPVDSSKQVESVVGAQITTEVMQPLIFQSSVQV